MTAHNQEAIVTMPIKSELLACPVCGGEPALTVRGRAAGYQCRGKTHLLWAYGTTPFEAAANWNTRTPPNTEGQSNVE